MPLPVGRFVPVNGGRLHHRQPGLIIVEAVVRIRHSFFRARGRGLSSARGRLRQPPRFPGGAGCGGRGFFVGEADFRHNGLIFVSVLFGDCSRNRGGELVRCFRFRLRFRFLNVGERVRAHGKPVRHERTAPCAERHGNDCDDRRKKDFAGDASGCPIAVHGRILFFG